MQVPTFPECNHAAVKALIHRSDFELVDKFQRSPTDGKYFSAIFCRYSSVVYSLIRHSARSPVQADYLFALTWRHILNELGGIDLSGIRAQVKTNLATTNLAKPNPSGPAQPDLASNFSLQGWLINLTAAHINQAVLPEVEAIHYSLKDAPPPLWCYTERALECLSPRHRLIVLMAQTFEWSHTRIAAYLQAEGTQIAPAEVAAELAVAYQALTQAIPEDVRQIYLDRASGLPPEPVESQTGLLTIEFDPIDVSAR